MYLSSQPFETATTTVVADCDGKNYCSSSTSSSSFDEGICNNNHAWDTDIGPGVHVSRHSSISVFIWNNQHNVKSHTASANWKNEAGENNNGAGTVEIAEEVKIQDGL